MRAGIEVLAGIAGSGKTARALDLFREALRTGVADVRPGNALWLSPTRRACVLVRERLLDASLPAVFNPHVLTFDEFASEILLASPLPVTRLPPTLQRTLLRRIVLHQLQERKLPHFAGIAATSGFLDLVGALIAELKRSEIWPEDFVRACFAAGKRPGDAELAAIYGRYQDLLLERNLYDSEGRFWSALEALKRDCWGPFASLDLVIVDGFTDFTHTQFEILRRLSDRSRRVLVSLPLETPLIREDLFARTNAVLAQLERAAGATLETAQGGETGSRSSWPPAIAQIAATLFRNPRNVTPSDETDGVEVVAVAGETGEVQMLASRIKRLLFDGTAPDDIVVALRGLDEYAGLFEEIFGAAGIQFACEAGTPLARAPLLKALLGVLQLEVEDWPFRRLMAVLDSSYVQPEWKEWDGGLAVREVARCLRHAKVYEGRQRMVDVLERLSRTPPDADDRRSASTAARRLAAQNAAALVKRLAQSTSRLRGSHEFLTWAEIVESLARELGLLRGLSGVGKGIQNASADQRAWTAFKDILFATGRAAEYWRELAAPSLTLAEFLNELTDLLHSQSIFGGASETGRVRVLDAEQVRNLDVPWLFFAGLTEKSFPQHRGDDCLYNEAERQALNAHGVPLGLRASRTQEEMLLFYGVVTRARRRLILSYPAVGPSGQPLSPSPYLIALEELFSPDKLQKTFDDNLDPIPPDDRILSEMDARIRGVQDVIERRPGLFRALCIDPASAPAARNVLAAVDMAVARFHTRGFTSFEGQLQTPRNISDLRGHYVPEREFSATQLETYAECPFKFFLSHVLKIEPVELPETSTDLGQRGVLVHELLADLHRKLLEESRCGEPAPAQAASGERIVEMFLQLLETRLARRDELSPLQDALLQIERRLLSEWGEEYGRQWTRYHAALKELEAVFLPSYFETSFGAPHSGATPDPGTIANSSLIFAAGEGEVRIGGRIDRVDIARIGDRTVFSIVDYKTGRQRQHSVDDVQAGRALQLALYTLAVKRLAMASPGAAPFQMLYWHIKEVGFVPGIKPGRGAPKETLTAMDEALWESLEKALEAAIPRLVTGIRSGRFPVINQDADCTGYCAYGTVCRVAQIRSLPAEMEKGDFPATEPSSSRPSA